MPAHMNSAYPAALPCSHEPKRGRGMCMPCYQLWYGRASWAKDKVPRTLSNRKWRTTERYKLWLLRHQLKKYGITVAEYRSMVEQQAGLCALCGQPPKGRRLAIDHNHETGKVRGLLCHLCNRGLIGRIESMKIDMTVLAEYLNRGA